MNKKNRGFTIIELLIVILILGILTAAFSALYTKTVEKSKTTEPIYLLKTIARAQNKKIMKDFHYTDKAEELGIFLTNYPENNVATGNTFIKEFFNYTIHGDDKQMAVARRNTGEYALSINYKSGILYCTPAENSICKSLGFKENGGELFYNEKEKLPPWVPCDNKEIDSFFAPGYSNLDLPCVSRVYGNKKDLRICNNTACHAFHKDENNTHILVCIIGTNNPEDECLRYISKEEIKKQADGTVITGLCDQLHININGECIIFDSIKKQEKVFDNGAELYYYCQEINGFECSTWDKGVLHLSKDNISWECRGDNIGTNGQCNIYNYYQDQTITCSEDFCRMKANNKTCIANHKGNACD